MLQNDTQAIIFTGVATFFFGFGAGAAVNWYLNKVGSPLVAELRGSLTFISSIVGDGVLLPIVNMVIVAFLLRERGLISAGVWGISLFLGLCVTAYFHIVQAVRGLVNWTMPTPWHWNILGVWHAIYMFSVATLVSMFFVVVALAAAAGHSPWLSLGIVSTGIGAFFFLLRLDYAAVEWGALLPGHDEGKS